MMPDPKCSECRGTGLVDIEPHFSVGCPKCHTMPPPVDENEPDHAWKATNRVLIHIAAERIRQDVKFGRQDHAMPIWLSILGEEFGELAQAILETEDVGGKNPEAGGHKNIRAEAIHVAAVAVALIECLDRNQKGTPK